MPTLAPQPVADTRQFKAPAQGWRRLAPAEAATEDARKAAEKEASEAARSLKETLLQSLQMQHLVVLAGSGTSLGSVGGPSMKDLWKATIGEPPSEKAKAVAQKIKYDITTTTPNIEDFLSRCDAFLQVEESATDVSGFVTECKAIILKKCTEFLKPEKLEGHQIFLHRLSRRRVRDSRLKLFTTNYDLCFERAASALGGVSVDGFSFSQPRRYDPRYFGYDIVRRSRSGEDQGHYLEGVFHLYKLHGSVNWARTADGGVEEKEAPAPEEACLIYPAKGKYQQSFLQPHLELLSQYFAALREPNTCLIVTGFGFNDDHLSEPIFSAIRSNPHLRLIIADPFAEENLRAPKNYWKKFLDISNEGEDVWFINAYFQDFAKLIPDLKSLTQADKLKKAIQNIAGAQ